MVNTALLTAMGASEELSVHGVTVHNAFQESSLPFVALYGRNIISYFDLNVCKQHIWVGGDKPMRRPRKVERTLGK